MVDLKYLIVGPSWIGDMVMAQVLFILLKKQYPEAIIDVVAPAWSLPLLERMPEVNKGFSLPVAHGELGLKKRFSLGRKLVKEHYDCTILLPNSLKSALVPFWAKIPKRTGWKGEFRYGLLNDLRALDKQRYPLMIQRFAALAFPKDAEMPKDLPTPNLVINKEKAYEAVKAFSLSNDLPILGICPGAEFGPAKRWPEKHYASVMDHYLNQGWQCWIFGSKNDAEIGEVIKASLPFGLQNNVHNLAGRTQLSEAIDLLSFTKAVVTNDSGLMHIAAALKRNLVAIYGSSSPAFTPPLNNNKAIIRLGLECSPCFKRECPLNHLNCLNDLSPYKVIEALDELQRV